MPDIKYGLDQNEFGEHLVNVLFCHFIMQRQMESNI